MPPPPCPRPGGRSLTREDGLALATLYAVALAVRLFPLLLSPLPYNIDGFSQVRLAQEFAATGHWSLDMDPSNAYNLKMPVLPLLLDETSLLLGVDPLQLTQPLMALVGAMAVPATYALARTLGMSRNAAVAVGTFLGLSGTFVFLTSSTMKEVLGLAFLPLALLLFFGQGSKRRGLAVLLLAYLPLVHSLATAMALAFIGAVVVQSHGLAYRRGTFDTRRAVSDGLLVGTLTLVPLLYYSAVRLEYFSDFANGEDLALLVSVAFVFALLLLAVAGRGSRDLARANPRALLTPRIALALTVMAVVWENHRRPIFAGTAPTTLPLLLVTLAYLPVAAIALVGFGRARALPDRMKVPLMALVTVPAGVMAFAMLRGLDPISFLLVYRSFDFLDFGFALALGLAAAPRSRPRGSGALGGLLVACLLLTLPAAFATEATFGVRNATTLAEFTTLGRFASLPGALGTDQRYGDIMANYWARPADRVVPVDLQAGTRPNATYILLGEDWASAGAQYFPLPRVVIGREGLRSFIEGKDVIYSNSAGLLILRQA